MTVFEKMNELVDAKAPKSQIIEWAYKNRITVRTIHLEAEFKCLAKTVTKFFAEENRDSFDEFDLWSQFLEFEFAA